jgi:hypothetical protein
LATRLAGTPLQRRRLWLSAFPPLHSALVENKLHTSDWQALDAFLPQSTDADRSDRLRLGAADAIVRDKWPMGDVQAIVKGAHPFEDRMLGALRSKRKKQKGWLRELLEDLIP